jgi:hypothetical protein
VTADAVADVRQQVRRAAHRNSELLSVIMGCASALTGDTAASLAALPGVRALVPGADLETLAEAIGLPGDRVATTSRQSGARALLRIQDGCDEHCTFLRDHARTWARTGAATPTRSSTKRARWPSTTARSCSPACTSAAGAGSAAARSVRSSIVSCATSLMCASA